MCGIVIGLTFGKLSEEDEKIRQEMLRFMTTELLLLTEPRGKDATGASVLFDDGRYVGLKRGERVSDFLSVFGRSPEYYGGFLKIWKKHPSPARIFLGHCRAGTGGAKEDNNNNHPIKIGNLIGIHNGVVRNEEEIFKNLGCGRDGQVDSEAIFRMFDHFTNGGKEPFTIDMIQDVVDRMDSEHTVCLFNADNPYQVPVFRDGRPCEFVFIKEYGLLFIISDLAFWGTMRFRYERAANYYESNLPPLFKCTIEKKELPDDACMIFDLTTEIGKDTTINDLGEYSKILRTNKKWRKVTKTKATTKYKKSTCGYRPTGQTNNNDENVAEKKRRVFDRIAKKYVVKQGDKVLEDDSPITMAIDEDTDNADDNSHDVTQNIEEKAPETTDLAFQEKPKSKAKVADLTDYTKVVSDKSSKEKLFDSKEYVRIYNYLKSESTLTEPDFSVTLAKILINRIQTKVTGNAELSLPAYYLTLRLRRVKSWRAFYNVINLMKPTESENYDAEKLKSIAFDIPDPTYKEPDISVQGDSDDNTVIEAEIVEENVNETAEMAEVEVDMATKPPELAIKAEAKYKTASFKDKGFINMDELLEAIDVKDETTADELGTVFIANRVSSRSWKQGFLMGYKCCQEEQIESLKHIIVLLAGVITEKKHKARLANAAMKAKSPVDLDMNKIKELFKGDKKVNEIGNILDQAHQYANTGGKKG